MSWYKPNIVNKSVAVLAFSLLVVIVFSPSGPWDLYAYLAVGGFLFVVFLLDMAIQALRDDHRSKK